MALGRIRRSLVAAFLRVAARVLQRTPRRLALALGKLIGSAAFLTMSRERRRGTANLRRAFGRATSTRELVRIARDCTCNLGRSLAETLRLPAMTEDEIMSLVDCDSFAPIEEVLARGNGIVLLTGHVGTWELAAAYMATRLGRPFHAIGRRLYYEPYNALLVALRHAVGVETVFQDDGARPALRVLHDNRALGILADQDVPRLDGVFVDFFGQPAYTPTGPAALARASGAGIVPFFITWENGRRHRGHVLPEVELVRTGDRRADAMENTRRWSRVVEGFIRDHPEQWVWFHRRWRTRPPGGETTSDAV